LLESLFCSWCSRWCNKFPFGLLLLRYAITKKRPVSRPLRSVCRSCPIPPRQSQESCHSAPGESPLPACPADSLPATASSQRRWC